MKFRRIFLVFLLGLLVPGTLLSQHKLESRISSLLCEKWWGGGVALESKMPFDSNTGLFETNTQNFNNHIAPLLFSSKRRHMWCEDPFSFRLKNDTLLIFSDYGKFSHVNAGETLWEAYLASSEAHFQFTSTIPKDVFFSKPQYNTWIELMYNQNLHDILDYAHKVLENESDDTPAIIRWWNEYSTCLDVTNSETMVYFKRILRETQEHHGIDGFKFDASDIPYLTKNYTYNAPDTSTHVFSQKWTELGLGFLFNEYRAAWKIGKQSLVFLKIQKTYKWMFR